MDECLIYIKTKLNIFCLKKKISKKCLATGLSVGKDTVRRWLAFDSKYMPSILAIKWLSDNYGLSIEWLICGKE